MKSDILQVVEAVSNEKGVDEDIIFEAIEAALASATRKRYGEDLDVLVRVNREDGSYDTVRRWEVLPDETDDPDEEQRFESAERHIFLAQAILKNPDLNAGEFIEEPLESVAFGRISAQAAKQVIVQKVREAERAQVVEVYESRIGELVTGLVKRMERGSIIIDLGGSAEAMIGREDMIPREPMRPGDRVRGFLREVRAEQRGPQLFISRTCPEFLIELFTLEVPEIGQGLIELKGAARDPGLRAKVAVHAKDKRIDPVGACVGMRGSRVQSVSNELAGERVDIVLWNENPAQFVINAMAPADVESIVVDEESHSMDIGVAEEKLAQAIGRGGQNIRLASELTGWNLNVMTLEEAEQKSEEEVNRIQNIFQEHLEVDEEVAVILVQEGFSSIEEIAYVSPEELVAIEEFDEDIVSELRNRARDVMLIKEITEAEDEGEPADDLLNLEGMDEHLARVLAGKEIVTRDDLADQAVDDIVGIGGLDAERAAELIMAARAHWFAEDEAETTATAKQS